MTGISRRTFISALATSAALVAASARHENQAKIAPNAGITDDTQGHVPTDLEYQTQAYTEMTPEQASLPLTNMMSQTSPINLSLVGKSCKEIVTSDEGTEITFETVSQECADAAIDEFMRTLVSQDAPYELNDVWFQIDKLESTLNLQPNESPSLFVSSGGSICLRYDQRQDLAPLFEMDEDLAHFAEFLREGTSSVNAITFDSTACDHSDCHLKIRMPNIPPLTRAIESRLERDTDRISDHKFHDQTTDTYIEVATCDDSFEMQLTSPRLGARHKVLNTKHAGVIEIPKKNLLVDSAHEVMDVPPLLENAYDTDDCSIYTILINRQKRHYLSQTMELPRDYSAGWTKTDEQDDESDMLSPLKDYLDILEAQEEFAPTDELPDDDMFVDAADKFRYHRMFESDNVIIFAGAKTHVEDLEGKVSKTPMKYVLIMTK